MFKVLFLKTNSPKKIIFLQLFIKKPKSLIFKIVKQILIWVNTELNCKIFLKNDYSIFIDKIRNKFKF